MKETLFLLVALAVLACALFQALLTALQPLFAALSSHPH